MVSQVSCPFPIKFLLVVPFIFTEPPYKVTQPQVIGVESRGTSCGFCNQGTLTDGQLISVQSSPGRFSHFGGGGVAEAQRTEVISQDHTVREGEQS